MKKLVLFALFGIITLMAENIDTSIYDEDGFKQTQKEQPTTPTSPTYVVHDMTLVYIERKTKLMWQDEKYTDEENGAYFHHTSSGKVGTWNHSNSYCQSLRHAGYDDWRLPTLDELMALHRYHNSGIKYSQAIDFWTSTPNGGDRYWSVFLADGYAYIHKEEDVQYFRCVRDYSKDKNQHHAVGRI